MVTRASEFSLAKPARDIYTRVGREWRYKGGAANDTVIYRGGDLTFVWAHELLPAFGSNMVFGAGLLTAPGMTFGAWRLLREASRLPTGRNAYRRTPLLCEAGRLRGAYDFWRMERLAIAVQAAPHRIAEGRPA